MNRKNPGLAKTEPVSSREELDFYRYSAVGWTIAAVLFTAYSAWRWGGEHWAAGLGWLIALWSWVTFWIARRKARRPSRRDAPHSDREE